MGLSKGGFAGLGLLSLPLMALVVSPVQAAAIMLPILIVQDVVTVWAYRRDLERPGARPRSRPACSPASSLGYLLAARVSDARRQARGRGRSRSPSRPAGSGSERRDGGARRDPAGARAPARSGA